MPTRFGWVLALCCAALVTVFGCGGGSGETAQDGGNDAGIVGPDATIGDAAGDAADSTVPFGPDGGSEDGATSSDGGPGNDSGTADSGEVSDAISALPNGPVGPALPATSPFDIYAATLFLYTGTTPIQTGVATGTIQPRAVAVIRGVVTARDGSAIAGASVTVLGHPELGQTTSQASGGYDLVVNGGASLTVQIALSGYLTAQRTIAVPLRDFISASDAVLVPLDTTVTPVNLDAGAMQVALGSQVIDQSGTRQSIVMFPAGTQATMTLPDGGAAPLGTLSVRSTEFTVGATGPQAMPATLPPTSAYTYATELSVDEAMSAGATSVDFNQPVAFYVDDIVGFGAGNVVPVGYYDRAKANWIPSANGLVVRILSIAGGVASLDVDGSGTAAISTTLTALGIANEELTNLATLRAVGSVLWRVPMTHFTPWDCNWGDAPPVCAAYPDGTIFDPGCTSPGPLSPPTNPADKDPCNHAEASSIIGCETRTLGEAVGLAGTPFYLRYDTGRARSFLDAFTTTIPLTGSVVPAGLKRVQYDVQVVGREFTGSASAPGPNLSASFTWDGLDAYGQVVSSPVPATIRVSFVYPGVYLTPARSSTLAFGNIEGLGASGDAARDEITLDGPAWKVELGVPSYQSQFGDGWSISTVHVYDPALGIVHLGTGHDLSPGPLGATIGTGTSQGALSPVLVGPTTSYKVPGTFTVGRDGSIYTVRQQTSVTNLTVPLTRTPPGGVEAPFTSTSVPLDAANLAVGPDGSVYYTTSITTGNPEIDRLDPAGTITQIASSTTYPSAVYSQIAIDTSGTVYAFVDQSTATPCTHRIVAFNPTTSAATTLNQSACGYNVSADPNDIPIGQVWFGSVAQIAVGADGSLYFVEIIGSSSTGTGGPAPTPGPARIRRMRPDGQVTIIYSQATRTTGTLFQATRIAVLQDGSAYACDDGLTGSVTGPSGTSYTNQVWYLPGDGTSQLRVGAPAPASPGLVQPSAPASSTLANCGSGLAVDGAGTLSLEVPGATASLEGVWRNVGIWPAEFHSASFQVPDSSGSEIYDFDPTGRHLETVDGTTGALLWQFGYDATSGLLTSIVDGDGNTTQINRNASGGQIQVVAPFGKTTTITLDASTNEARSIADPLGDTISLGFAVGTDLLGTYSDPDSSSTHRFQYDPLGRLVTDERPSGSTKTLSMTVLPDGREVDVTTSLGRKSTYRVETTATGTQWTTSGPDALTTVSTRSADLTRTTSAPPDGTKYVSQLSPDPRFGMQAAYPSTSTVTTPSGLVQTVTATLTATLAAGDTTNLGATTTLNGNTWTAVQSIANQTITATSPMGRVMTIGVDARNRPVSLSLPGVETLSWTYETSGRPWVVTFGNRTSTLAYDTQGNLHSVTDPLSNVTTFGFDAAGRLTQQTLPDSNVIGLGYDDDDNLTSVVPPGQPAQAFTFYPGDLAHTYAPPTVTGSGTTSTVLGYNGDEQLVSVARPDGIDVIPAYDPAGRLETLTTPTGTTTVGYSPTTGQLWTIASPGNVNLAYAYDGFLPTGTTWSGAISGNYARTFDASFRFITDTIDGANAVSYGYDDDGLLTSAGSENLTLDPNNGFLTATSLGGVTDALTYDEFGAPQTYAASYAGSALYSFNLGTRDALGRVVTDTETIQGTTTTYAYNYDTRGRLWHVTVDGVLSATYVYSPNGNRTSVLTAGGTTSATFDDQDRMLTNGSATYTYGANGELATKTDGGQTTTYTYDALGNLREVQLPGETVQYLIDGENRRVAKIVNGATTKEWLYRDGLKPIAELDSSGNVTSRFIYGSKGWVPDQIVTGGKTYRVVSDRLGSPRLIVDSASGAVAERIDFDAWGNVANDTQPGFEMFGFAGGIYDADTGLTRFGARDYDPSIGRWTTKDPAMIAGGLNRYGYCDDEPTACVDITGAKPDTDTAAAAYQKAIEADPYSPIVKFVAFSQFAAVLPIATEVLGAIAVDLGLATPSALPLVGGGAIVAKEVIEEDSEAVCAVEEESVTLYRGVTSTHPGFADATEGTAYPRGGDGTVFDHNLGDTETEFTSWTSDPGTARAFATRGGGPGIVLETQASPSDIYLSPDEFGESEYLLKGPVLNATPTSVTPWR
jgi:RHS repeat-associated protein